LGGIPEAAALLLLQLGDTGGKGPDLIGETLVLLKQLNQQGGHADRFRLPIDKGYGS
jgi:hypothetical protein